VGCDRNTLCLQENHDIEVYYLKLNENVDDKGEQVDVILDALRPLADEFFDKIIKTPLASINATAEGYQLDAIETLKLTKEVLTGWRLRMVLPIDRTVFFCA